MSEDYPALPPDEQDARLGHVGDESIFQKIRLLTNEERDTLNALFAGGDIREFLRNGKPSRKLRDLQRKVPDIMDRLGLTDEVLIQQFLKPLLNAQETRFFQNKGIVCDQRNVKDHATRLRALDIAFQLRGAYAAKDSAEKEYERTITVNHIHIGTATKHE